MSSKGQEFSLPSYEEIPLSEHSQTLKLVLEVCHSQQERIALLEETVAQLKDEIVAFAEVEKFIDTPVKFYPSRRRLHATRPFAEPYELTNDEVIIDQINQTDQTDQIDQKRSRRNRRGP